MKKQIVCGVMASMLVLSGGATAIGNVADLNFDLIASAAATQDSGTCGTNVTWTLDDEGTLTISGTGAMANYTWNKSPWYKSNKVKKIIIGKGVTVIGSYAFSNCKDLTTVTIPDTVTNINNDAFYYCSNLSDINIPNSVTNIGERAFEYCSNLTDINIPNSVTSIGSNAFWECTSLTDIYIPQSVTNIESGVFYGCSGIVRFDVDSKNAYYRSIDNVLYSKKDHALIFCPRNKTSVTIPYGIKTIDAVAFSGCKDLKNITIPNGVTSIGEMAFEYCTGLESVNIPGSVKSIGWYAFTDCTSLKSVIIPNSVTGIGSNAFGFCGDAWSPSKIKDFKIYCYKNSEGEKYAKNNKFDYEIINTDIVPTATSGDNAVKLTWSAVSGAEKYAVCSYTNGKWQKLAEGNGTSYTIKNLTAGKDYKVAVIGMFSGNWITDFSNAVVVTPNPSKYPQVTDIEYNEEFHQFRLTWNAVKSAEEYGVAVKIAGKWKVHTYTSKTSFTSPKLRPGSIAEMVISAKVNGEWDTTAINRRSFMITVK